MLRYTYILNFVKIHQAVVEILRAKTFLQKIKKTSIKSKIMNFKKKLKTF